MKNLETLTKLIKEVPNFPKQGVMFRDISPLLSSPKEFNSMISAMAETLQGVDFDAIAGIESRGFILGSALAVALGKGFIPIRKKGKLPPPVERVSYDLEYGQDTLEMAYGKQKVILVDDVLATGGTLKASIALCEKAGYKVEDIIVLINLKYLNKFQWNGKEIKSLFQYEAH